MPTAKILRQPPNKFIQNYVASIKMLQGEDPTAIPDKLFPGTNFGGSGASITASPIGFTVNIDGISYSEFYCYPAGWLFLKDPNRNYTVGNYPPGDLTSPVSASENENIKSNFTYNHLLIAPWFEDISPVEKTIEAIVPYYSALTPSVIGKIKAGEDTRSWPYDQFDYSVRFTNYFDINRGKSLIVRWTVSELDFGARFKFECVLSESGFIEFKYWPAASYEASDTPASFATATVGVFSGASIGTNKFRDLSPLFGYRRDERVLSDLGGSEYFSGFSENSKPYANRIPTKAWPKNGAILTLAPQKNTGKFLPRRIVKNISNSKKIEPEPGLFDDRKTILFNSGISVHYPSLLPSRLVGDTGNVDVSLRQLLYTSGSIQAIGSSSKSAIDGLLLQIDALEKSEKRIDNSFNESQKDYSANTNESSFYATGSALENFGEGFNSPLKSKTQIVFSLPVNKQTEMPSLTSSFYYYDRERKQWTTPYSYQAARSPKQAFTYLTNEESDSYYYYRVTETSLGFDSVGRKISSGSSEIRGDVVFPPVTNFRTFQTDPSIGAIFNQNSGSYSFEQIIIDSALTKDYQNSLTDSSDFYPKNYHQINTSLEYPFLVEKIVVEIPIAVSGAWFDDVTTCNRAYLSPAATYGFPSGAIDFGGPGITFAIHCPRRGLGTSYLDLIASGTITHQFDDKKEVLLNKVPGTKFYSLRPVGFKSFSNPTTVISGVYDGSQYKYVGSAILQMESSIAGGLTFARNDRSLISDSSNITKAIDLVTNEKLPTRGEEDYKPADNSPVNYQSRAPRIYIQQVSPPSRGTSGFQFCGNSILGNAMAEVQIEKEIINPLYISSSGSLPADIKSKIDSVGFIFDAVSSYTTVDSKPSPYLLLPGDKLAFSISKTRPVINYMRVVTPSGPPTYNTYGDYTLSGSHGNFILNTGSIDITLYGSYVREGREFNP